MTKFRTVLSLLTLAAAWWLLTSSAPALAEPSGTPRVHRRTPAPSEPVLVLQPVLAPPAGTEGAFIIKEKSVQGLAHRSGLFALAPDEAAAEVQEDSTLAVRARYTMLSPDPQTGEPRVFVEALPIEPDAGTPLRQGPWQATFLLTEGSARWQEGSSIPEEYRDLVHPDWLAEWAITPPDQLPRSPMEPGFTWQAVPDMDLPDFPFDELHVDVPLTGRFVAWEELPGAAAPTAHLVETMRGISVARQEVSEGIPADVAFEADLVNEFWLLADDFPHRGSQKLHGTMVMVVDEASGAPSGVEGSMEFFFSFERSIERDPAPEALTGEPRDDEPSAHSGQDGTMRPGETVTGVLGPGSETLEDGTYAAYYAFHGTAGDRIRIRLESRDFDAYLFLLSDDENVLAEDDDGGGGSDALIHHTLPYTGMYWIVANTLFWGETGSYTLSVEREEPRTIDFHRALELIALLRYPHVLSDGELQETEDLLYELLELTNRYRVERSRNGTEALR